MNIISDRVSKIIKISNLERDIKNKKEKIQEIKQELELAEKQYKELKISSLPILLFMIDETLPMPDDDRDYIYEYIYYCPDIDDIKYVIKNKKDELLPNAIDLRENFTEFGVPKRLFPAATWKYKEQVKNATSVLNNEIANYIANNQDITWQDLGLYLVNNLHNEGIVKVLKPKK